MHGSVRSYVRFFHLTLLWWAEAHGQRLWSMQRGLDANILVLHSGLCPLLSTACFC